MNLEQPVDEVSQWYSTYGLITAERILGYYNIKLPQDLLLTAVRNPQSFFHRILQVPLKNVLNGIVQQQAHDYYVYAQKLYIDYLLSPESSSPEEAPGASTREALEEERQQLISIGDNFQQLQYEQSALISSSQVTLIKTTNLWSNAIEAAIKSTQLALKSSGIDSKPSTIRKSMNHALAHCGVHDPKTGKLHAAFVDKMNEVIKANITKELKEQIQVVMKDLVDISLNFESSLSDFDQQAKELSVQSRSFRTQFYETILRVLDLLKLLPEYRIDQAQDLINRESLHFDKTIGDSA